MDYQNGFFARLRFSPLMVLFFGLSLLITMQGSIPLFLFRLFEMFGEAGFSESLQRAEGMSPNEVFLFKWALMFTQAFSFGLLGWLFLKSGETTDWPNAVQIPPKMPLLLLLATAATAASLPFLQAIMLDKDSFVLPAGMRETELFFEAEEARAAVLTKLLLSQHTLFNVLVIAITPALCEEIFFRGFVQTTVLRIANNGHAAVWISAAIFSFLHFQVYGFFPRMFLGVVFGYLFLWSGSLWPGVFAHFVNNGLNVWAAYLVSTQALDPAFVDESQTVPYSITLASFVLTCAFMFAYRQLTKKQTDEIE